MDYREQLANLMEIWTEDNIDIRDDWSEWENFLTDQKIIKTYEEVCEMDLEYLKSEKDMKYWDSENEKWDIDKFIKNDNDIVLMENGCYFVHYQEYISQFIIDKFYEQQEEKRQNRIQWAISQAYIDLNKSFDAFSRFDALLFILAHDFGKEKLLFNTEIDIVKKEMLYCISDVLKIMNEIAEDGSINIWIQNHQLWADEENEHYCELIRFGGYGILADGQKILNSDVIILKDEESIHTLDCFTYQNIDDFCEYIAEEFESYKNKCYDVGDREDIQDTNDEINEIIDKYWRNGKIDFNYGEMIGGD